MKRGKSKTLLLSSRQHTTPFGTLPLFEEIFDRFVSRKFVFMFGLLLFARQQSTDGRCLSGGW